MKLCFLSAFALTFLFGCVHKDASAPETAPAAAKPVEKIEPSRRPPTETEMQERPGYTNVRWYKEFDDAQKAQAGGSKEKACSSYKSLAADADFPLKDLALIRAAEMCPSKDNIPAPWKTKSQATAWFAEDVSKAEEAAWDQLTPTEKVNFLWGKASIEKEDRPREKYLNDAIAIAEKASDETLAAAARQKLYLHSPRLNPKPLPADLTAVVSDYRHWREFDKAVKTARTRLKESDLTAEETFGLLKGIRATLKTAQMKDEMIKATADLVNFASTSFKKNKNDTSAAKRLLDARTLFARTLWTENRQHLALESLREARRELSGRVSMEEVFFLLGRLAEEDGKLESAEGYFTLALNEKQTAPGMHDRIRWARAWSLHKTKNQTEAGKAFAELAKDAKDPNDRIRASYWQARILPEGDERKKALMDVRTQDPLGFYGLMVSRDLGEKLPPLKTPDKDIAPNLSSTAGLNPATGLIAEWLIALHVQDGTVRVLDSLQNDLKKNSAASNEAWLNLSSAYARAGEYLPLFALIGSLPPETRDQLLREHPDLLFPKPFLPDVQKAAAETDVPAELIYSIIRQESAFNPRARSAADAHGLTQLLPQIAAVHAQQHHIPYHGSEDLQDPAISVRLGAWELRALFDRWKGLWIPAIASYNANADAVKGWLKTRQHEDAIEFIEEIPYEETRSYVKLVMRNQVFYQRMLANEPTAFPEKCLRLNNSVPH